MRCLRHRSLHRLTHRHWPVGHQALVCDPRWLGRQLRRRTRYYVRAGGLDWTRVTRTQFVAYAATEDLA